MAFIIRKGEEVIQVLSGEEAPQGLHASYRVEQLDALPNYPADSPLQWDDVSKTILIGHRKVAKSVAVGEGIAIRLLTPTDWLLAHSHPVAHQGYVITGTVTVRVGLTSVVLTAPAVMELPANIEHEAIPVTPTALWASVYPDRIEQKLMGVP